MFNQVIIYFAEIALCMVTTLCSHLHSSSVETLRTVGNIEIQERSCCDNIRKIFKTFVLYSCKENQLDALLILSIFRHSTSTCFGSIYVCCPGWDGFGSNPTRTTESQIKNNKYLLFYPYGCTS
jgi:hypothetical protein